MRQRQVNHSTGRSAQRCDGIGAYAGRGERVRRNKLTEAETDESPRQLAKVFCFFFSKKKAFFFTCLVPTAAGDSAVGSDLT